MQSLPLLPIPPLVQFKSPDLTDLPSSTLSPNPLCRVQGTKGESEMVPCKLVQPLWKTVWRFLRKLKIELPYDPAIPLLGIYPDKSIIQKDTCTPMFTAELFTIAKTWKQPKCPSTDEWIKKMWYIYTMEYYSAIKKPQ